MNQATVFKRKKAIDVSVVIPVYNELANIAELIVRLSDVLSTAGYEFELIFVDDTSTDGSLEYLQRFKQSDEVVLLQKKGKKGKAFSLVEGFPVVRGKYVVMIDADLQYPPEAIPPMIKKLKRADIVVANRKIYKASLMRRYMSRFFRFFFGQILFGLRHDIQSGLKAFNREVIDLIRLYPTSGWTFDLEFLHRAKQAGFSIVDHDITFAKRKSGRSKINSVRATLEICFNAIRTKYKRIYPVIVPSLGPDTMLGAGIRYKKQSYITHTTLPYATSAIETVVESQKIVLFLLLIVLSIGLIEKPIIVLEVFVAFLSFIYFLDVLFNLVIIFKSLYIPQEIRVKKEEFEQLKDRDLPVYSILCPLYNEAHILPQFLSSIKKLDWPKNKLEVLLLLEEDDTASIMSIKKMDLPPFVSVIIVPDSQPKTKPKACNYGLSFVKGDYVVIFDAEDIPDPLQLKKSYVVFNKVGRNVICLQAKLNYFNPHQNLLTRFFSAEYSLWFDVTLTGLQSINTSLPLGGTSNHFRIADLRLLQGWDPFNVTEDADLGIRLFNAGYRTAIFDSTTLEEANSNVRNWIRQRSRWIKGYMQTYLVHMRRLELHTFSDVIHLFYFQMTIGGKIAFTLINPFLWVATISYFTLRSIVGPTIESLYAPVIFYMALVSLVFGNFLFLYYYMIGCAKRGYYDLIKYVYLVPLYWIMLSIAGFVALYQLIFKPFYWEKTHHGFAKPQVSETEEINIVSPFASTWRYVSALFF